MENIINEIEDLINQYGFLVITGFTASHGIMVNVGHLRDQIKKNVGITKYRKHKEMIIESIEKLRDRVYSKCRYTLKSKMKKQSNEKIEYLINRTKRRARCELGRWICQIREWDTLGVLTFANHQNSDRDAEERITILYNYLIENKLISDFFYCIEQGSEYHINFYAKVRNGIKPNILRQKIKTFWFKHYGGHWIRKYRINKESESYWIKDVYSNKQELSNGCWNIFCDIENLHDEMCSLKS